MAAPQRDSPNIAIDGAKLRRARHEAHLTQVQLAEKAEIGQSYVSSIEDGSRKRVSPPVYGRLCAALHLTDHDALTADQVALTDP